MDGEKYDEVKQNILTSAPSWVHLLPSPLGCVILTFISLTLPNFPSPLGLGKALAPHLQFRRWGHTQPESGKLGPVFHPEELLKLLKQGMV